MKYLILIVTAILFCMGCGDEEVTSQVFDLQTLKVDGSSLDVIIDGQSITIFFEQEASNINYTLSIDDSGKFSASGGYRITTKIKNNPLAPEIVEEYSGLSYMGEQTLFEDEYWLEDDVLKLNFSERNLDSGSEIKKLKIVEGQLLQQDQEFVLSEGANMTRYTVTTTWRRRN